VITYSSGLLSVHRMTLPLHK